MLSLWAGSNSGLKNGISMSNSWKWGMSLHLEERIFAEAKTKILRRGDHPGISELYLNPMVCVLIIGTQRRDP